MIHDLDLAISRTTLDWVFSERTQRWYPIIQGGAPDEDSDSNTGDDTSVDNDDAGSSEEDHSDDDGGDDDKKVSSAEVAKIVARETAKAKRGLLSPKELGFDSAKEMKDWIESQRDKAESDKTEEEKAREKELADAKAAAEDEVLSKANARLTRAEFMVAAADHDVEFRDDAFALAQSLDSWERVEVDDDGNVTGFDDEFFDELKEKKPFVFKQEAGASGAGDIGAGTAGASGNGSKADARKAELAQIYGPSVASAVEWEKQKREGQRA